MPARNQIQFSLSVLLWTMAVVAVVCGVSLSLRRFPYENILPTLLLLVACWTAVRRPRGEPWGWIALAWTCAMLDTAWRSRQLFWVLGVEVRLSEFRGGVLDLAIAGFSIPLALTIPALLSARRYGTSQKRPGRKWLMTTTVLAAIMGAVWLASLYIIAPRLPLIV